MITRRDRIVSSAIGFFTALLLWPVISLIFTIGMGVQLLQLPFVLILSPHFFAYGAYWMGFGMIFYPLGITYVAERIIRTSGSTGFPIPTPILVLVGSTIMGISMFLSHVTKLVSGEYNVVIFATLVTGALASLPVALYWKRTNRRSK